MVQLYTKTNHCVALKARNSYGYNTSIYETRSIWHGGGGGIKFFFKGNPIPKATEQLSFAILFTKDSLTYTYLPLES